eukprot:8580360-Pyramimonas_sp.AAC.1
MPETSRGVPEPVDFMTFKPVNTTCECQLVFAAHVACATGAAYHPDPMDDPRDPRFKAAQVVNSLQPQEAAHRPKHVHRHPPTRHIRAKKHG